MFKPQAIYYEKAIENYELGKNLLQKYDDVPKTADSRFNPLWLVGLAAVCFAGSLGIKKVK